MPDYYPPPRTLWYVSSATEAAQMACYEHLRFELRDGGAGPSPWSQIKDVVYHRAAKRGVLDLLTPVSRAALQADWASREAWVPKVEGATQYAREEDAVSAALLIDESYAPAVRSRYAELP